MSDANLKDTLLSQVRNALDKSEREAVVSKLKALEIKRKEAERAVKLIVLEMEKVVEEYESGV